MSRFSRPLNIWISCQVFTGSEVVGTQPCLCFPRTSSFSWVSCTNDTCLFKIKILQTLDFYWMWHKVTVFFISWVIVAHNRSFEPIWDIDFALFCISWLKSSSSMPLVPNIVFSCSLVKGYFDSSGCFNPLVITLMVCTSRSSNCIFSSSFLHYWNFK